MMQHIVTWESRRLFVARGMLTGVFVGTMAAAMQARADDSTVPLGFAPDKSAYTLFNPTPDDEMRKFTPDRPAKGYSVRTVDAGHIEVETDFVNYNYSKYQGTINRSIQALDPNFKLGLTDWMDVEVQFNGLQYSRLFDIASTATSFEGSGFGDVFLRTKMNLFGNDSGPVGFALIPYVKVPSSALVISNGAVEGGLIAPLALRPEDYIVTLMTEIDELKTATGDGHYTNFANLISVSHPVLGLTGVNAMAELYSSAGTDPAKPPIYTFDLGANVKLDKHTIIDVGLNLGLNKAAPKAEIYTGISFRY